MRRRIQVKVNPGEPTDGSGKVCIHLFVKDDTGPFVEPHVLHPAMENGVKVKHKFVAKPTRGVLACDRNRSVKPVTKNGVTTITHRTDDPRAITCPKCRETELYKVAMVLLT